jgi:Protein of unknown function (DUF2911).
MPIHRWLLSSVLILFSIQSYSQEAVKSRPSPLAIATTRYKDAYLKIIYGQPHKRGREIFGKVVAFGEVWRTGANEATELTVTRDVIINNETLKAGTYSLFTIPAKEKWTVIINSDLGLWGSYNYNSKTDVMRFEVPAQALTDIVYEAFTILVDQKGEKAEVSLLWDQTKVSFTIQFLEPK